MKYETHLRDGATVIRIDEPRIDAAVAARFKDTVRNATEGHEGRVIVDMSNIAFLDSSGLGAVVAAMKLLGRGRKLELASLNPTVLKVFQLTRMDKVFPLHANVDAAFQNAAQVG